MVGYFSFNKVWRVVLNFGINLLPLALKYYYSNKMASLQTLRNKGGIIVAVIIGIALLAFVLGDMLTSGSTLFGSNNNNVGEIDGTSITAQQYSSEINTLTEVQKVTTGQETVSEEQSQAIQMQAWEQLVRNYAIIPALEKAGITVTTPELEELLTGRNASPIVQQVFADPETGMFDVNYLRQFVSNIDKDETGRMAIFWNYIQSEVTSQALIMKYKTLVDQSIYVTSEHAEFMAGLESDSYSVRFVADRLSSISDSTVSVSDAEVKDYYEANKNSFERTTSRSIEYVVFETLPSEADYAEAAKYIESLKSELATATNVQQFVSLNSQSPFDARYYKEGELSDSLGKFAFSATEQDIFTPEINGDEYTLARISDVKVLPDSVNFSHIVFALADKAKADSVAAALRKGDDFALAATTYSLDKQTVNGLVGTLDPQTLATEFTEPLYTTAKGGIAIVETSNAIHIIKINDRIGDGRKVQLGTIHYVVEPSQNTRGEVFANATKYFGDVNGKGFDVATKESMMAKRSANIVGMQRELQGLPSSREAVRWAYNAKKVGEHSTVMEFGDNFVIASLTAITDEGVAPLDAVKSDITAKIIEQKKGEMIAQKMTGATSLDGLSAKIGQPVVEGSDINFATFIVPEVGFDPAFAGGVCGAKNGELSKPIVGLTAVYVAQVVGQVSNPVSAAMERERLVAEAEQSVFRGAYETLIKRSSIKDERYKFY